MTESASSGPRGLGGWLILVMLGLFITPIRTASFLATTHWPLFRDGGWQTLTTAGTEAYHPLWGPILIFEVIGNLGSIALAIVTLVLLFKRSRQTPRWAIAWLAWALAFVVADFFLANLIPAVAAQSDAESTKEVFKSLVSAAIWIPYFLVSKRVKATFVK